MFQEAANIIINGGTFTVVSKGRITTGMDTSQDIVAMLAFQSAKTGLLDSAERFDAPKCSDGTRISTLSQMKRYVQRDGPPSIFWLHGPAGVGKSAVAQSLALSLLDEGDHAASFFFSRTAPGRKDGNQLFVTLACQLAINIPAIKPLLAKVVKENPLIFNATNATKMQSLIVDPINQLHKRFRQDPHTSAQTAVKCNSVHPRLILIDGLDECDNPQIQRDILLCIARAVRQLLVPFRFVIASRPEPHILATFEHDPIFSGIHGVIVEKMNLRDDLDADAEIRAFLKKEFIEIGRTHPIRQYLPRPWPTQSQIDQLVSKSSKGFMYPATVIQYIKMPENRPDECLDRILGLSDIPAYDKPYEPLDALYRHIFESLPNVHKEDIRRIFHFLVVPYSDRQIVTPHMIDRHFGFKPGHVEHILRRLLCLVEIRPAFTWSSSSSPEACIEVLHASLPDFLLDHARSGPFHIDVGDAHATQAASLFEGLSESVQHGRLRTQVFRAFLGHLVQAHITDKLQHYVDGFDVVSDYCHAFRLGLHYLLIDDHFHPIVNALITYLQILAFKKISISRITEYVRAIEAHVQNHSLASALHPLDDKILQGIVPLLHQGAVYDYIQLKEPNFFDSQSANVMFKLHVLLLTQCIPSPIENSNSSDCAEAPVSASSRMHAQIADIQLRYVIGTYRVWGDWILLKTLAIQISAISLPRSAYSTSLISTLKVVLDKAIDLRNHIDTALTYISELPIRREITNSVAPWFIELAPHVLDYLRRMQSAQAFISDSEKTELAGLIDQYQEHLTYFNVDPS